MSAVRAEALIRVGKTIAKELKACGMSQSSLARMVGVSVPFMNYVIHGRRSTSKLRAIEDALALPPGVLNDAAGLCPHCEGTGYRK